MEQTTRFENFPLRIVLLSTLFSLSIYALGIIILASAAAWLAIPYLIFCLALEYRLLRNGCANCYYYGKRCGFGKGNLCSLLFKPGDPQRFATKSISWTQVLPDFLVSIIPLVVGIAVLITDFNWLVALALVALLLLSSAGNAFIRGSFACKYCKQRDIGCPAEKLFNRSATTQQP